MSTSDYPGKLYVCPIINTMGPVKDPLHADLLTSWPEVDQLLQTMFSDDYRQKFPDCAGNPMIFSWYFISWSGFKTNPVNRDFGYFNIYDYYKEHYGQKMEQFRDEMYWMYNHPAESGVGNEWGLDWFQNTQYLEILMRFVAERNYFPSVVEVITENNETSHFLENFFPYDLGNRNSVDVNWEAKNADGKPMHKVIDWRQATHNWNVYSPSVRSYQKPGNMQRKIGRLLDIKTIVYEFKPYEIEKAFQACLEGKDCMISGYEHDFRYRAQVILDLFIEPIAESAKKYPEVQWFYKNSLEAFNLLSQQPLEAQKVRFTLQTQDVGENLLLQADNDIFGKQPFTFWKLNDSYGYVPTLKIGEKTWLIPKALLSGYANGQLYVACNSPTDSVSIDKFSLSEWL